MVRKGKERQGNARQCNAMQGNARNIMACHEKEKYVMESKS
jgi:hypothetical protein